MDWYLAVVGSLLVILFPMLIWSLGNLSNALLNWHKAAIEVSSKLDEILNKWNEAASADDDADWWKSENAE